MKKYISFLIIFLIAAKSFGQGNTETKPSKVSFGPGSGIFLSELVSSNDAVYPHGRGVIITYENKYVPGFFINGEVDFRLTEKLSLNTDLSFIRTNHIMKYLKWSNAGPVSTGNYADYKLTRTNMRIGLFPAYSVGNEIKFVFSAGPFLDFPLTSDRKGQVELNTRNVLTNESSVYYFYDEDIDIDVHGGPGLLVGLDIEIPAGRFSFLPGVTYGKGIYNVTQDPYLKETFISAGIKILIRTKTNLKK